MGVDADELILRPFKEVIERGHEAAANASDAVDDSEPSIDGAASHLAKAGRALVKEGERALKRLQPVWDGQVERYGDAFKDAMLQLEDIEKRRMQLDDLLYDFDDYIEIDTFDGDKFAAVQAATRSLALDVINHAKRIKLDAPRRDSSASQLAAAAAATIASTRGKTFPPLPPLPPLPPMPRDERRSGTSTTRSSLMKTVYPRAISSISSIPPSPKPEGDEDTIPDFDMPHISNPQDLRRGNTRSSTTTSSSRGVDAENGRMSDRLDRYERFDRFDRVDRLDHFRESLGDDVASIDPSIYSSSDVIRVAATRPTVVEVTSHPSPPQLPSSASPLLTSAVAPRTSAWVRSHQANLAANTGRTRSGVRGRTSRDTMATDYSSSDSPVLLSRLNSLTVSGTTSAAPSLAASLFDPRPSSPGAMTDSRTSCFSSAANSYTSGSPVVMSSHTMPALPPATDPRDPRYVPQMAPVTLPSPFASPSLPAIPSVPSSSPEQSAMSTPEFPRPPQRSPAMHPGADRCASPMVAPLLPEDAMPLAASVLPSPALSPLASSQSIRDFIRFAPSPPVLPIGLPLSPKLGPRWDRREDEDQRPVSPVTDAKASFSLPPASQPSALSDAHYESGLMLAEESPGSRARLGSEAGTGTGTSLDMSITRGYVREADCSIGPKSSFARQGGFCKGAEAFRLGGHWEGVKQQGGFVANKQAIIGRCISCGYGHNYEEVRLDMEKKPDATFTGIGGVRFRLRLLYKSHIGNALASQRQAESNYACVFCAQAGATVREGDATVFTNSDQLLLHLARHPQPLPAVAGIIVLYGNVDPDSEQANNFDLHLARAPLPTPMPPTVGQMAVATAIREHLQRYGTKKLARPVGYGGEMLQFITGARIVGLMFPERWEGKWCMGWHDGVAGAFPAKAVQIEPPRQSEIPMESSSGMNVTARWKWKPKAAAKAAKADKNDKGGKGRRGDDNDDEDDDLDTSTASSMHDDPASVWLEFDKGETISNVKCLYADHWCWAGTNSKGFYGVFPQSHILTKTLQQEPAGAQRPKTGWSTKFFNKGASHSSRRPPSSAASTMSSSTGRTRRT